MKKYFPDTPGMPVAELSEHCLKAPMKADCAALAAHQHDAEIAIRTQWKCSREHAFTVTLAIHFQP
ncbi:hypothetical protein [Pseudomonas nitroreducens]|uniref:hypothetical protein n=1 Tax=Pseudomonas nitroreducens TaxID=46680 RepID=UPI00209EAEE0|nr:hypothetical protein [Pseudomonas nitroreducens]MCP1621843.1 hypothetical protein [Pseudomonas nitroreducens]